MPNKFNPYRPDKIATPGMFAGRLDEIFAIDQIFLQTKNGNAAHFLIEGERGIGKSSLVLCAQSVAKGENKTLLKDEKLNFIVLSITLSDQDDYFSLVRKIANELQRQIAHRSKFKTLALTVWEFISRLEAAGVKFRKEHGSIDDSQLLSRLQDDLVTVVENLGDEADGIALLIDEADKAPVEARLGMVCKLLTEEMTKRGHDKLTIGLAGLPNLTAILRDSHESSPRIFKTLSLKPLEDHESKLVIDAGLNEAEKYRLGVRVTDEAKNLLVALSGGYPHFLQEFCYYAYEADSNNIIDKVDVTNSLHRENGAFDQLGHKFFNQYYAAPSSDNYRIVLHAMAEHLDGWVSRSVLIEESGLDGDVVDKALHALELNDVILQDETKLDHYRVPTKSFAVWLRARNKVHLVAGNEANVARLFDR